MRMFRPLLIVALPFVLSSAACGNDSVGPPTTPNTVNVADNIFNPTTLNASPGVTVTWNWVGSQPHDVTWVGGGLLNSPTQTTGTHQVTMPTEPGEYDYYCTLHGTPSSGMRGTVVVE